MVEKRGYVKKAFSLETLCFLGIFSIVFGVIGSTMGAVNMLNTMMKTAYELLMDTVLYIMAIAVLAGAMAGLFSEFGVIAAFNKLLSPLMKPLYGLPGASILGVFTTYLSDNPAVLTLAEDNRFKRYFKKYQLPALTNLGTSFGMGLIITTFVIGVPNPSGSSFLLPAFIGNVGAIIGSIVSVRLMLFKTKKIFGTDAPASQGNKGVSVDFDEREVRDGTVGRRFIEAMLEGGKSGIDIGLGILPGVLIICTFVLMITNGPGQDGIYSGEAFEGIGFLPMVAEKLDFILEPLFGFNSAGNVAVPITALGAAGAAIGLIPEMVAKGMVLENDIAVFTAMCMCWSGYLSTHIAMMDTLKFRELTGHAIFSHTIGGLCAGISAHLIYLLL